MIQNRIEPTKCEFQPFNFTVAINKKCNHKDKFQTSPYFNRTYYDSKKAEKLINGVYHRYNIFSGFIEEVPLQPWSSFWRKTDELIKVGRITLIINFLNRKTGSMNILAL